MRRAARVVALLGILAATTACRHDLVVRAVTRVFPDGAIERHVEAAGRPADPDAEVGTDWLVSTVGLKLARPGAWDRVEVGSDRVRAWGFFPRIEDVPPALAYRTGSTEREERTRTTLEIDERIPLRRFVYREEHGDPFGPAEVQAAIDRLLDLACEAFRREVERDLGGDVDPRRAEERLRTDLRPIVAAVLAEPRTRRGPTTEAERRASWVETFRASGAPVAQVPESQEFWGVQAPGLLDWSRIRLAEALSTPETAIAPDALAFWPAGDDWLDDVNAIVERNWGGSAEIEGLVTEQLAAIEGYFGSGAAPRVRFEIGVELPGTLLRTNGTPDGAAVIWLVRAEDLGARDVVLEATSVEIDPEALADIGARKDLDRAAVLRLADLLWDRDRSGVLAQLLGRARAAGGLGPLRDLEQIPEEWIALARELADLLDPEAQDPLAAR